MPQPIGGIFGIWSSVRAGAGDRFAPFGNASVTDRIDPFATTLH